MAKTTPKVRVPEERIKMYTKYAVPPNTHKQYPEGIHKLAGPFDIALIKLKTRVTLMPGRVVPVGFFVFLCWGRVTPLKPGPKEDFLDRVSAHFLDYLDLKS